MSIYRSTSTDINLNRKVTDLIKFLSCLMIALHHYSIDRVIAGTHNPIYQLLSTQGGWLGVAIFFFLSGYGLMKSELKNHIEFVPFVKKRLLKTYFPAVLVSIIWGIYIVTTGTVNNLTHFLGGVLWNFNDGVLWFVRAIVCLYAFFYLYAFLRNKTKKCNCQRLLLIAISTFSTYLLYVIRIIPYPVHASSALLFFLGIAIAEYSEAVALIVKKIYPLFILFAIIITISVLWRNNANVIHWAIDYILVFAGIAFVALYSVEVKRLPTWVGGISYDTYLVHYKAKLLLSPFFAVIPLWAFASLTILLTIMFYYFRKCVESRIL